MVLGRFNSFYHFASFVAWRFKKIKINHQSTINSLPAIALAVACAQARRAGLQSKQWTSRKSEIVSPKSVIFILTFYQRRYTLYNKQGRHAMLAIRLDKEIERDLDLLARRRGSNRSAVVREAILQYLEDNEDLDLAKQAQSQTLGHKPLKQLREELGLDS